MSGGTDPCLDAAQASVRVTRGQLDEDAPLEGALVVTFTSLEGRESCAMTRAYLFDDLGGRPLFVARYARTPAPTCAPWDPNADLVWLHGRPAQN